MALKKKIVFVAAPPASGKTYVCERLAEAMGRAVYLDKDDLSDLLRAAFRASGNEVDMDGEFYVNNLKAKKENTMLNIGNRRECFFDSFLIDEEKTTAERRLHKPTRVAFFGNYNPFTPLSQASQCSVSPPL